MERFACHAASTDKAAERAGPQRAAVGKRLLAASEGQLRMLPSLEFALELEVAAEQRGALLDLLQSIPLRLPRLLKAHGVDMLGAEVAHTAESSTAVRKGQTQSVSSGCI